MIPPIDNTTSTAFDSSIQTTSAKAIGQIEDYVQKYPAYSLLIAAGIGLAAALVTRALAQTPPPPPRNRALRLLEDIQHRLSDLAQPAYNRVSGLAEDGVSAVSKGVNSLGTLHLNRKFDKLSRGIKNLFQ